MKQRKTDNEIKSKYRGIRIKGKKIDVQRHVMELMFGRKLDEDEVVHHIDGNKLNNEPSNLKVMKRKEHTLLHMKDKNNFLANESYEERKQITLDAWAKGCFDSLKKRICAYNKKTKELVKEYDSISLVEKDGHARRHVQECLNKIRKTHHGLIWKYKNNNEDESIYNNSFEFQ